MRKVDVAVVGAGPFGLSVGAQLAGRSVRVFGEPMKTWRTMMPPDMLLRSAWDQTSLAALDATGSIIEWADREGVDRTGPISLHVFLAYADWFRSRFVPEHDPADVSRIEQRPDGFKLYTSSGEELVARRVVLAVGVTPFTYAPSALASVVGNGGARFSIELGGVDTLRGRRLLVVGGGQSALETAGLAARAGADVELVCRSRVRWFADREPYHPRGRIRQRLYDLAYPAVGFGPPPINRLALHPDLFAWLPSSVRRPLTNRLLRPGGSPWLRSLVEDHVKVTEEAEVESASYGSDGFRIRLGDGSTRLVDELVVATGYRFDLAKLEFLDERLARAVRVERGWPVLDRFLMSSVPGLFFVGYPAEGRFGPISRFVFGTGFSAVRVREGLVS